MKSNVLPLLRCGITAALLSATVQVPVFGRDIDVDAIYIKKTSRIYQQIADHKLGAYRAAGAVQIDENVIFAGWASGGEIVYIRELPGISSNIICRYSIRTNTGMELHRVPGVITCARLSPGGSFIALKRLVRKGNAVPIGETLIYRFKGGSISTLSSGYGFLDFDIPATGDSIVLEGRSGIEEYFPASGTRRGILERQKYADIVSGANPSVAYLSPDRKSVLVINGGGGSYAARLISENGSTRIDGISSVSEIAWLDMRSIVFRSGATGSFAVMRFDCASGNRTALMNDTLNSNIVYSPAARKLTFLKDQLIIVYDDVAKQKWHTGIEGEDASFSPGGHNLISLLYGRLHCMSFLDLQKKEMALRRTWEEILAGYRLAEKSGRDWENDYSLDYIRRKVNAYSALLKGDRGRLLQ
jgi:hypothetical protein